MSARTRPRRTAAAALSAARAVDGEAERVPLLDPIITMNAEGVIQSASDSVERVFGWTPMELFGRNVKVLIPEPRRSALDRYLDRYRQSDRPAALTRKRRFEAVRKNGTILQIELSMSRADLPLHASPFFIGIIRDVSSQIDVGSEPAEERTRLHRLITEQTRALATANLRIHLADRLASLGSLAAGLGHDLNNVLLPVRARLDALDHVGVTAAAREHLTALRRSIGYLQKLSDGLHFLAVDTAEQTGGGVSEGGEGATDLAQWWGQAGAILRTVLPSRVALVVKIPEGLPSVGIAPQWLTQAVLNLIVNAGEATVKSRHRATVRVWADTVNDGRTVRLGVTDNGRGMSAATRRRALDLFFSTKPRSMGTGLGLPLARKVAGQAGGGVEITSALGKGTTAVLMLPAIRCASGRFALSPLDKRSAVVSVRDHRTAALISQILVTAGLTLKSLGDRGPGTADVWVTEPKPPALAAAVRWRKGDAARTLILAGLPSTRTQRGWAALHPAIIDLQDDFPAMKQTLGRALLGPDNS